MNIPELVGVNGECRIVTFCFIDTLILQPIGLGVPQRYFESRLGDMRDTYSKTSKVVGTINVYVIYNRNCEPKGQIPSDLGNL